MKTKYFLITLIALVVLMTAGVLVFYLYQSQQPIKAKVVIREAIGYPFWVAEEKGFFKDKKIEIEETTVPSNITDNRNRSEAAKDFGKWLEEENIAAAVLTTDELFNIEIEYPDSFKAFVFVSDTKNQYSTNLLVGKDSKISSVKDLEGKKIGADVSDIDHFLLAKFMEKSGISNFKPVKITRDKWAESLEKGTVDALWASEPQASRIIIQNIGRKLVENPNNNPKTEVSEAVINVIAISSDFLNKKPKIAQGFKEAIEKALEADEDEIREITQKRFKGNEEVIKAIKIRTYPKLQNSSQVDKTLFQKIADMMYEGKYISKSIDTSRLIY